MTDPGAPRVRELFSSVVRGFIGRCPACGAGRVLQGYIKPVAACAACAENLAPYQTADFAPYLVTFFVGLVFTPLVVILSMSTSSNVWVLAVTLAAALASALVLLPRAKGAAIGILWALDVKTP